MKAKRNIDGYPYHNKCYVHKKAEIKYKDGYRKWLKIKRTIKYLGKISPVDLYKNTDRLDVILESFGFDIDKL